MANALARGTYGDLSLHDVLPAVRALVAAGGPEDLDAARKVFSRDYFASAWHSDREPVIAAFGDKAGPALYAFVLRQINDPRTDGGSSSYQEGKPPQRRTFAQDAAREFLESPAGKRTGISWPADETEGAQAVASKQLKLWPEEHQNWRVGETLAAMGARLASTANVAGAPTTPTRSTRPVITG